MIRVTVWNENVHEREHPAVKAIYPAGIHGCIAAFLGTDKNLQVRTATLEQAEHGLTREVLDSTDVLIWWGHMRHEEVTDEIVQRVKARCLAGMGLVCLHSAHHSKIMKSLLGTTCNLRWRHGDRERLWVINPGHPIARNIPESFVLDQEEMYGEWFDIPEPDEIIFLGWFSGGEVFRSGCTFTRGRGRIFYFQPGHEEYPVYHHPVIQQVIHNGVGWASQNSQSPLAYECVNPPPPER